MNKNITKTVILNLILNFKMLTEFKFEEKIILLSSIFAIVYHAVCMKYIVEIRSFF